MLFLLYKNVANNRGIKITLYTLYGNKVPFDKHVFIYFGGRKLVKKNK